MKADRTPRTSWENNAGRTNTHIWYIRYGKMISSAIHMLTLMCVMNCDATFMFMMETSSPWP